ncbi:MAG: outer membrane lipoprotein carrier protein LolA, partial [Rectinemataceae bacterium]|nr:outer membrane lipoprotein carrier protein LolA [Rectinemataceae bacterium]
MKTALAVIFLAFTLILVPSLTSQDIQTAEQYFGLVSERYAQINDYEGQISINTGKQAMYGTIAFKIPSLLRIDFSQPAEQVIVYDGARLLVYIPQYQAVLSQESGDARSTGASLATRDGLKMMKRSYTIAWETSPEPVPIDPGSSEMVMRLS